MLLLDTWFVLHHIIGEHQLNSEELWRRLLYVLVELYGDIVFSDVLFQ